MTQLAIKGHATRGKEVIKTLEMLGGVNQSNLDGNTDAWYMLKDTGVIRWREWIIGEKGFTLEEFHEKFPYKVGDKVLIDNEICTITRAIWDISRVLYKVNNNDYDIFVVEQLQPYKEETMESKPNLLLQQLKEYFDNTPRDVLEKEWNEYDKYNKIGPTVNEYLEYVNKSRQSKYPKTYEECIGQLPINWDGEVKGYKCKLLLAFQKLLIARDVYWKKAGEQMGLGKPWEPDWADTETDKYVIEIVKNTITIHDYPWNETNHLLAFPTKEMRDAFYENFKDLIIECKELL